MRAAFCTFIGSDAFKLLCSLCAPKKPEECTYDALKTKLDAQYRVKKLECYHFYNYKQTDGQSLTDYLAELCRFSATCDWTEPQIADNLRDKFVMGLQNERLLQQLLMKDHKKPLEELFQLALMFKAAEKESLKRANTSSASDVGTTVGATRNGKNFKQRSGPQGRKNPPRQTSGTNTNNSQLCASCGSDHLRSTCKFRNAKCHSCGKLGHIHSVLCNSWCVTLKHKIPRFCSSASVKFSARGPYSSNVSDITTS